MITESDLRDVLTAEARAARDPADLLARLALDRSAAPRRRWRAWLLPVAAAAAVAIVVSLSATLAGSPHRTAIPSPHRTAIPSPHQTTVGGGHTLPPMPGRAWRYTVTVGAISGYDTGQRYLTADHEVTEVLLSGGRGIGAGQVIAYPSGGYDPTAVRRGRAVTVQGHQGYFGATTSSADLDDKVPNPSQVATLAWQSAPNRWIVIQGWKQAGTPEMLKRHLDPFTEEMRVARAVHASTSAPVMLPYRVDYLPGGLQRCGASSALWYGRATDWTSGVGFGAVTRRCTDTGLQILALPGSSRTPLEVNLTVNGHPARFEGPGTPSTPTGMVITLNPGGPNGPVIATSGPQPRSGPPSLTVDFGPVIVTITGRYSRDELVTIAQSITLAPDPNDQSTWFDATK